MYLFIDCVYKMHYNFCVREIKLGEDQFPGLFCLILSFVELHS